MNDVREEICRIGRLMYQNGYVAATNGNISVRLGPDRFITTPSGLAKGFISPDQLIEVDPTGNKIESDPSEYQPTSEIAMHLECYRQRTDVMAVIHAHPPFAVALTIAGIGFNDCVVPEAIVLLGEIPTAAYATPATPENREAIRDLITHHDAIMLAFHGSLTVAKTLWDAYMHLESLEHTAKIMYMARQLGEITPLPRHELEKLVAMRERMRALY
jgi:L-fuculose-phosphate aldolase